MAAFTAELFLVAMNAAEAHAAAAAEGLALLRADNPTGFKHVGRSNNRSSKQYQAKVWDGRRTKCLGSFVTAEEA